MGIIQVNKNSLAPSHPLSYCTCTNLNVQSDIVKVQWSLSLQSSKCLWLIWLVICPCLHS